MANDKRTVANNAIFTKSDDQSGQALSTPTPNVIDGMQAKSIYDILKEDFGLTLPVATISLPSQGLIYPTNSSWHNCKLVEIKPITTREEDILTNRNYHKKGIVINELIKSCLVKKMNPNELISGDKTAILYAIRAASYGSEYQAEVTCSDRECKKTSEQTFDIAKFEYSYLKIQPVAENTNIFEFILPQTKLKVHFKFLTGLDEDDINMTTESNRKMNPDYNADIQQQIFHHLVSVNGVENRQKLHLLSQNLSAVDSSALRKYISDNEPRIITRQSVTCPYCGNIEEVDMPIGASFLWPNAR